MSDDEWCDCVSRDNTRFDDLPLRRRLDFVERFALTRDWTDVGFGSVLEPAELDTIASMMARAIVRLAARARAQLDTGDTGAAHATLLEIMRASPLGLAANTSETRFGSLSPQRPRTLLGDIIAWEWARVRPALEDARLRRLTDQLLSNAIMPPALIAHTIKRNMNV